MTDVLDNTSKKLTFSLLRQNIVVDTDEIVNTSDVPGVTLSQVLDYLATASWQQLGFDSRQEIISLTSQHISQGYVELENIPVSPLNIRVELLQGQLQINKAAISPSSGSIVPNYEMDSNLRKRMYFKNISENFEGQGNAAHSDLSEDFVEGQILVVTYLYAVQPE